VVLQPLAGADVGALIGGAGVAVASRVGIDDAFIRDVGDLIKPGTSALFLLTRAHDLEVLLHRIRGLGGTVLKTTVDLERAKQIQASLDTPQAGAPSPPTAPPV
jgi:uncharacterized membrane protein